MTVPFVRIIVALLLVTSGAASALGAPPPPRPDTGIGTLVVSAFPGTADPPELILYREPGVGRIAAKSVAAFPHLAQLLKAPPGEYPLAVTARKGMWLQVIHDDAGRTAWLEPRRAWPFISWDEILKGRGARLLRGLKKPYYVVVDEGGKALPVLEPLTPERAFRIIAVEGDRIQVLLDLTVMGWLRWRDEDGRLLITLE